MLISFLFNTIVLEDSGEINSLIIVLNSPEKVLFEAGCQFEIQQVSRGEY